MIELFHPPKPWELPKREPSFVHRIKDDPLDMDELMEWSAQQRTKMATGTEQP